MADTVLTDAARFPQDEGLPNIADGSETWESAGLQMLLGQAAQSGSYVRTDQELDFASHDATNDTVAVQPGVAYLSLAGESLSVQGNTTLDDSYNVDVTTATMPAVAVVAPTATTVSVQDSTLSSVWIAYATDGTVTGVDPGDVYLRSDDTGSVTAPPHPSVEIGQSNPDDASADTLANRYPNVTFRDTTHESLHTADAFNSDIGDGVDYLDPAWVVRSDAIVFESFGTTLDGYLINASGSGTASATQSGFDLSTGTTSGSHVRVQKDNKSLGVQTTWDKRRSIRFGATFEDTQGPIYIATGSPIESDKTREHIAFAMIGGDLKGSVADGTGQSTVTLVSGASASVGRDLRAELYPGTRVDFYVNGTKQGELSNNLPSGASLSRFLASFLAQNSTTTDRTVTVGKIGVVQEP